MNDECVFCKIASGELPSNKVKDTADFLVIHDIHPSAPTHLLIIPKKHIVDALDADSDTWLGIQKIAGEIGAEYDLSGFRLLTNVGDAAAVSHLHVHFLAGIDKNRQV